MKNMRKTWIVVGAAGGVLLVVFLGLALVSGTLLRRGIEAAGSAASGVPTTLDSASLSLMSGRVQLGNLVVGNPEGFQTERAAAVGAVDVQVGLFSLLGDTIRIAHIDIEAPEVTIEMGPGGTNLGQILAHLEHGDRTDEPAETPPGAEPAPHAEPRKQLTVGRVRIVNPRVILAQSVVGTTQLSLQLGTIELTDLGQADAQGESTRPGSTTLPQLIQHALAAIAAAASKHQDVPANLAALLQQEIELPSLKEITRQTLENLEQIDVKSIGEGLEEAGKNLKKSVDGLLPRRSER